MKRILKKIIKKFIRGSVNEIVLFEAPLKNYHADLQALKSASNLFNTLDQNISSKAKIYAPFAVSESSIGDYTYIAQNSKISLSTIGKFCSIGPNFLCGYGIHPLNGISTAPMFYSTLKQNGITLSETNKIEERKLINIGNDVFIGMNVSVLDGVTIGDGAVIGAGAVVAKDIPPYAIAVGNPIQIIKYRFTAEQISKLLTIKWWDFEGEKLKDVEKVFFDIDGFIEKHYNA